MNHKQEDTNIGVHAILVDRSGQLILQKRDVDPKINKPGKISMFGGTLHEDEAPMVGLKREVSEETGLDISKFKTEKLNIYEKTKLLDGIDYTVHVYIIRDVDVKELEVREGEVVVSYAEEFLSSNDLTRITRLAVTDDVQSL